MQDKIKSQFVHVLKKHQSVIVFGDFNFPNIINDILCVKGLDGMHFLKFVQEKHLGQYLTGPSRDGAVLVLILGCEARQVAEVVVGERCRNSKHNMVQFIVAMNK